jgi:NTP pyrophosphatase (non-canonical NTP hydrolase)
MLATETFADPSDFHARLNAAEFDFVPAITTMVSFCDDWFSGVQGFDRQNFDGDCMLIVTELAEAVEADRKSLSDTHIPTRPGRDVELADALVRILHTAAKYDIDLAGAFMEKLRYNLSRPVRHGKRY